MKDMSNIPAMNPSFQVMEVESTDTQATIAIEPLEQGYGHTLGNALRRVMLSSLPGHAITQVRVEGVDHQYTTLEGVSEDILELMLNLKQVRVKAETQEPFNMRLSAKGPGQVTAASIEADSGAEVINTDLVIANLVKGTSLDVEMRVESGTGYVMSVEGNGVVIGDVPIDALYSPVVKASYKVESTRVGRRTDFDRIVFQIQTDGSIKPLDAVLQSAKILASQFTQVFNPAVVAEEEVESSLSPEEAETLRLTVEELDLPTRIANALRKGGFKTVADLQGAPRITIAKVKNLGEKSVDVINDALVKKGVTLGQ